MVDLGLSRNLWRVGRALRGSGLLGVRVPSGQLPPRPKPEVNHGPDLLNAGKRAKIWKTQEILREGFGFRKVAITSLLRGLGAVQGYEPTGRPPAAG